MGWRSSYDDVISAVEYLFDQLDPSTATQMEEVCWPQGGLCWKKTLFGQILWEYPGQSMN